MNVSIKWLGELVELPNLKTPNSLNTFAQQVTEHCFEVEKIHASGHVDAVKHDFTNVFTAKVVGVEKHPNADRLRVISLDVAGATVAPVVCGAWNFDVGNVVALALPGAHIPHNVHSAEHESYDLDKAKIRGVESQGMICSAFELGIVEQPEERPEILVLKNAAKSGVPLESYLAANGGSSVDGGPWLEVSLPPNRPDLCSHVGIAREVSAALNLKQTDLFKKITSPKLYAKASLPKISKASKQPSLAVAVQDAAACGTYIAIRMKVTVAESPKDIKSKISALGLRPVNNVVDITNLVMHEVGEPIHAFDAAKVSGGIIVRQARAGEAIVTIDHKSRNLQPGMLVIADATQPLAVAGIMGGTSSEVSESTAEIILECANFDPVSIRKTSRSLGLRTDGSGFWEKGLKPEQAVLGAMRALGYLEQHAGAEVMAVSVNGSLETPKREVPFTVDQINGLLGSSYSPTHVKKILGAFGFAVSGSTKLKAALPYFRQDVLSYADLAEEVLKVTGMNETSKVPLALPKFAAAVNQDAPYNRVKSYFVAMGFSEAQNYSFISDDEIGKLGQSPEGFIKIKNPLSNEQGYLKQDLLAPLLRNVALNEKNFDHFRLFEVGIGYFGYGRERDIAAFVIVNKNATPEALIAEAKGVIENLVAHYTRSEKVSYHVVTETSDLTILVGSLPIGTLKGYASIPHTEFSIRNTLVYAQVELKALLAVDRPLKYIPINRFPVSELDTSLVVSSTVTWKQIQDIVYQHGTGLISSIDVFEASYLYPVGSLPEFHKKLAQEGKKNIAFRVVFSSTEKTLTDSEISPIYAKILVGLKDSLGAEIR